MPVENIVFDPLFVTKHLVLKYDDRSLPGDAEAIYMERTRHDMTPRVIIPKAKDAHKNNPKDRLHIGQNTPSSSIIISSETHKEEMERRIKNYLNQNATLQPGYWEGWFHLPHVRFWSAVNMDTAETHNGGWACLGGMLSEPQPGRWTFEINHLGGVTL